MRKRLGALAVYSLFWILFFYFARLFFLIVHHKEASEFSFAILSGTFTHGIRLDISATAYILILPLLAAITAVWIKGDWYRHFIRIYSWIILFISSVIIAGDAKLYSYWGFRLDYTVLLYLKTPQEAAASVTTLTIIVFCLTFISMTVLFGLIYNRIIDRMFSGSAVIRNRLPVTLFIVVLICSLIVPIRGGFGVAPINAGAVYFNENMFVNHSAINVVWNAGSSYFNRKPAGNPYAYGDLDKAVAVVDSLTVKKGVTERILNTARPNILFIILESFGNSLVGPLGGDSLTTPNLNKLAKEGLLFSNFYASGNRTDKALPAILDGYPAQPAASIIKEPKKTQTLQSLVKIMNRENYNSSFWYGGDINFANFNSFLIASGFRQIITKENFNPSDYNSKWGVHDHILFKALKDSMMSVREPFFRVVLTLSSHEPFEIPADPVFKGKDDLIRFKNSVYYSDSTVGNFISWARTTKWWKNTLVILVGDHCRRNSTSVLVYSREIFKIPMLWVGGALNCAGKTIEKIGTQVDIPVTLLNQLDIKNEFSFGKDLLSDKSNSFAFYTFNEGFAFITDSSTVIYDHKLGAPVLKEGHDTDYTENLGKAYLQVLYNDFMKR